MSVNIPRTGRRPHAPRERVLSSGRRIAALAALVLAAAALPRAHAADACAGAPHCRVDGPLMSQVVKVNVTHSGRGTAYQTVRSTVRFTNLGQTPLVLGYHDKSATLTDDQGLAYRWSSKTAGIGRVTRSSADPQFQLAPGESRDATFENTLQYNMRNAVPGTVFDQSFTLVQLAVQEGGRVRSGREYALGFPGLTATSGLGARPAAAPAVAAAPVAAGAAAAGVAAPGTDPCAGQPGCQAQGPLVVQVTGINVSESSGVTRTRTVRTTLRIRNAGSEPIILGYRVGSATLTDDQGLAYNRGHSVLSEARYVHGIGQVSRNSADPQFQLAPGQSRDAAFDSLLQYNVRNATPGKVYSFDITLAQLAVVGNRQVRTEHEYALSFAGLSASTGLGGLAGGVAGEGAADAAQAVGQLIHLFKGLGK